MRVISVESVGMGLHDGLHHLYHHGCEEPSRNGSVVVSRTPVMTVYNNPLNRVLVSERRDANPFFHLFESLWMLAGKNDLAFPQKFVSTFGQFSDDGATLHGAYGYRWRNYFGYDQLPVIIAELKKDPKTRRAVLAMWDGGQMQGGYESDLVMGAEGGKDVPCNTHAYFDTMGGKLNMTVCCRSNDIVLGCYGANAVHFSFLLEYMAIMTGIPMGVYRQFSNNYHAYTDQLPRKDFCKYADAMLTTDIYSTPAPMKQRLFNVDLLRVPLLEQSHADAFHHSLAEFTTSFEVTDGASVFFDKVVMPMYVTWSLWKTKEFEAARIAANAVLADDWRAAAISWLKVRADNRSKGNV